MLEPHGRDVARSATEYEWQASPGGSVVTPAENMRGALYLFSELIVA